MNLRELAGFDGPYWSINREERNAVALLYAALLQEPLHRPSGLLRMKSPPTPRDRAKVGRSGQP